MTGYRSAALKAALLALLPVAPATAQGMLGGLIKRAQREAERKVEEAIRQEQPKPAERRSTTAPRSADGRTIAAPAGPIAPSATVRQSQTPQNLWLLVGQGGKFIPPEGKAQIIATNPFLRPEKILFAKISWMDCLPDGSLIVSGEGMLNGDVTGLGWWRVAPDGAITSISGHGPDVSGPIVAPYQFGVGGDGSLLTSSRQVLYRFRDHRVQSLAGMYEVEGFADGQGEAARFKGMSAPLVDPQGMIWLSDQDGCVLRRVTPAGVASTVIRSEQTRCGSLPGDQRITLDSIAWDAANGELVAAGSVIVARPAHDLHAMIWRIRPDGQARRVYHTVKGGRSAIGQNMDHIWAVTVDADGRIVVGTRVVGARARRQIMRLDEKTGRLVPLTGQAFNNDDLRPGHEEAPYDGPAAHASFRETRRLCYGPDRTLFVLDEHLVRRVNPDGTVRSWVY